MLVEVKFFHISGKKLERIFRKKTETMKKYSDHGTDIPERREWVWVKVKVRHNSVCGQDSAVPNVRQERDRLTPWVLTNGRTEHWAMP